MWKKKLEDRWGQDVRKGREHCEMKECDMKEARGEMRARCKKRQRTVCIKEWDMKEEARG